MTPTARRRPALLAAALAVAVVACEEGQPFREPLVVRTASGGTVDLSGTAWEGCREDLPEAGRSQRWREIHGEEGAITFVVTTYDAPACSGTASDATSGVLGTADGEAQVGWTGGTAPGALPASLVATRVLLDAGFGYGLDAYLVDDTAEPRVLYTGDPATTNGDRNYPTALLPIGVAERQP